MILKVDHIGIAVRSIDSALRFYADALGMEVSGVETVADQKTRVAMIPAGESRLELLEATEEDSPVARFIARRGEGLHHVCLLVDDITAALASLQAAGIPVIDRQLRRGAAGNLVAFIHPAGAGGVLLELSQSNTSSK